MEQVRIKLFVRDILPIFHVLLRTKFTVMLIKDNFCSFPDCELIAVCFDFGCACWVNSSYKSKHIFGIGEMWCGQPLLRPANTIYF